MFAAPQLIATETIARVPDELRIRGRLSAWASVHRSGKPTDCFLEGPAFDRHGNLYTVDLAWGRIFKVTPNGLFKIATEYDGQPNGLKIHRDGRIFIADRSHGILGLDPSSGALIPVLAEYEGRPFLGVNDLVFARNGDLYFTDQGMSGLDSPTGRVFRYRANGALDLLLDRIPSPNGLVLNRDETTLFVNVTRDNTVWRIPMTPTGAVHKVGAFIRLSGGIGPDGLAIDAQGNLAIAHPGLGAVWLVSPMGEPIARIQSCAGIETTNVAYGGPENRDLYITESETGQILKARLTTPGWPMFSDQ
jgi:gluconolactonase